MPSNVSCQISAEQAYELGRRCWREVKCCHSVERAYSEAIELDPTQARYWLARAQIRAILWKHHVALEDVSRALALDANLPEAYYIRAWALKDLSGTADILVNDSTSDLVSSTKKMHTNDGSDERFETLSDSLARDASTAFQLGESLFKSNQKYWQEFPRLRLTRLYAMGRLKMVSEAVDIWIESRNTYSCDVRF